MVDTRGSIPLLSIILLSHVRSRVNRVERDEIGRMLVRSGACAGKARHRVREQD